MVKGSWMQDPLGENEFQSLIQTGINNPIAIALARTLLEEAEIPFIVMDENTVARQESGNMLGWWNIRVPADREAEAREILRSVEDAR